MVIRSILASASFGVVACISTSGFADDANGVAPISDAPVRVERPNDRLGVYGIGGIGVFGRESGGNGGFSFGGDVGYAFRGGHGLRLGYAYGVGIFGPEVHAFDLDYSYQWSTRPHLDGMGVTFGVLLGPAFGVVSYGGNAPNVHGTFGGRGGAFLDLDIWMATVGLDASYRFGFAGDYGAESYATFGLHVGMTFEVARR